ncbi:hypothetical protein QTL97_10010 [Sporosarcina thermotolerans]|uniref:Lipoprotein n=1 Tax=Sporosarcina thermotolerans TaxID=633404 RepID=A0AAW9A8A1_9BACL|nr:hypothetical protein [Sporosarcina thermotolerans]MDW0117269.1 hypothetical protein [Sporosarcina thermotolerans]WHT47430.1 hypothetical protein QNH10_14740 [Sporosarcina thermotolerans]
MKKFIVTSMFLFCLSLYACQANNKELSFIGEVKNWFAIVTVNQSNGNEIYQIQIEYKGDNLQDIKTFGFYVKSKNNGVISFGGDDLTLNKEGVFFSDLPISNSPSTNKNDKLEMKIDWNGSSEEFTLLNESNDTK